MKDEILPAMNGDLRVSVCFVCLGNICRSPTAEGIFRRMVSDAGLSERVHVESAGIGSWHLGEPADPRARAAARRRGVELDGRAQRFSRDDFARFDYVVSMDAAVLEALRRLAVTPADEARVHNFRTFDLDSPSEDPVPDPYYGGTDGFDDVFAICEGGCRGLLARIRRDLTASA
jgi:protein-tyrosine phosphatase